MSRWAYYQDIDEEKCEWVRELIKAGVVTDGEVDCRDIKLVTADDVRGFRRVHFFCGIAVWDYALNLAKWGDREVWTGSCPCPSFSCAGKGEGFDDPRHPWPDWFRLIGECKPSVVFGEQVNAAIGHGWFDLVHSDMENAHYAIGAAVLGACSVGGPHRRQRLYFVGERTDTERDWGYDRRRSGEECDAADGGNQATERTAILAETSGLRDALSRPDTERNGRRSDLTLREAEGRIVDGRDSAVGTVCTPTANEDAAGRPGAEDAGHAWLSSEVARYAASIGATRGFWADCDWWYGRDSKHRPIEPGVQPLVAGFAKGVRYGGDLSVETVANTPEARVLRLRGYGDSIVAPVAVEFIRAFMESK